MTDTVSAYYNRHTSDYLEIYGTVIQAFRPSNTEELLQYIGRSARLSWKHKILDLGCGVAGPALYFAKKYKTQIDGITISEYQVEIGSQFIQKENLENLIQLFLDDYHQIEHKMIKDNSYDNVLFLESLGHAIEPNKAIQQAHQKLKKGAYLYIKDFYRKQSNNKEEQNKIDCVISNINKHYEYNVLNLVTVIDILKALNFKIVFIKPFEFIDDTSIRAQFEESLNINIFEGISEFYPADWLEILAQKI